MPLSPMRTLALTTAACACAAATIAAGARAIDANSQAEIGAILSAARQALGGDAALNAITSFSVTGSAHLDAGGRITSDDYVEFACQLPDKFVRVTRHTLDLGPLGTGEMTRWNGFNGDDLIDDDRSTGPLPTPPVIRSQPSTPAEAAADRARRVGFEKRAFVEFTTPLFVLPFVTQPLAMSPAGRVTGPTGPSDAIDATAPDGFTWRLFFDPTTHLLAAMTWMGKPIVTMSTSQLVAVPPRGTAGIASQPPLLLPANPTANMPDVQWQLVFTDYRVDDGVKWPHRMTRSYPGREYEQIRLGKFKINPKINASVFKTVK